MDDGLGGSTIAAKEDVENMLREEGHIALVARDSYFEEQVGAKSSDAEQVWEGENKLAVFASRSLGKDRTSLLSSESGGWKPDADAARGESETSAS